MNPLVSLLAALALAPALAAADAPSYVRDIAPIFQKHCVVCHSEPLKSGGLLLTTYAQLIAGGKAGPAITAGKGSESLLIKALDGRVKPRMPQGGEPLPAKTIALIRAWIDARAPGPGPGESESAPPTVAIPDIKPSVRTESPVGALAFAPGGMLLAMGRYKQVQLLHLVGRKVVATLDGHADLVRALAFSADGKLLAAGGGLPARAGEIKIWDVGARRALHTIAGHSDNIYAVAFSPDGKWLASAGYDKVIKLWDAARGAELKTLKDHTDAIYALSFSRDGTRLASGAADRTLKIWDPASGQRLFTLSDALDAIHSLAWHPSGKQIAAAGADKTLRTWELTAADPPGGKLAQSITGHDDAILQVTYSPDGKVLLTASADGRIKVWDPETLVERHVLPPQPDWVMALVFSPDGKYLAAGRYDGSVSVYDTASWRDLSAVDLTTEAQSTGRAVRPEQRAQR